MKETLFIDKIKRLLVDDKGEKSYKEFKTGNLYLVRQIINYNPRRDIKPIKGPYKPHLFKPTSPPEENIYTILIQ